MKKCKSTVREVESNYETNLVKLRCKKEKQKSTNSSLNTTNLKKSSSDLSLNRLKFL